MIWFSWYSLTSAFRTGIDTIALGVTMFCPKTDNGDSRHDLGILSLENLFKGTVLPCMLNQPHEP